MSDATKIDPVAVTKSWGVSWGISYVLKFLSKAVPGDEEYLENLQKARHFIDREIHKVKSAKKEET
tara:strand:- start:480 stop:677 length:198 start_codon:yes stop_codon:yes gene_type:complete